MVYIACYFHEECDRIIGGGGKIMKFHCFATNFTSINCSSETTKGRGESIYFLKALFNTNSENNVSRITTSRHIRRNEYSL